MNRDDFIRFLARAVADTTITEAEAVGLLQQFDTGTLSLSTLPLLASEMDSGPSEELIAAVLIALALLRRRSRFVADAIQDVFERRARVLAAQLVNGEIDIQAWQRAMNEAILRNLTEQTVAGSESERLSIEQRQRIRELMREQNAYLSRFADTIAVKVLVGAPIPAAVIAHRAESYGGVGRGEYFRASEQGETDSGAVYEYIAQDDDGTCAPCHNAQGFYLPGEGPYPGAVCQGRGRCRCKRELRIMPDVARRLRGD